MKRECECMMNNYSLSVYFLQHSMGLLGEFLVVLDDAFQDRDIDKAVSILDHLSKTSRFNLSIKFLSQKERCAVS